MSFFWIDTEAQTRVTYQELLKDLTSPGENNFFIKKENPYFIYLSLLRNLMNSKKSIILDSDFSQEELLGLGLSEKKIIEGEYEQSDISIKFNSWEKVFQELQANRDNLEIEIYTSGTTGRPKNVSQTFKNITRAIKQKASLKSNVWAFAYNATHFAGLQVFFQGFFNKNTLVYVFKKDYKNVYENFLENKVSHLSCTPTFMKMFLPNIKNPLNDLVNLTFGGEKFDTKMVDRIKVKFPNAIIKNVYASTEAGSLLRAEGEYFIIPHRYKELIKIKDNEIQIHKELLGKSKSFELQGDWYKTGDIVEFLDTQKFKFKDRKSEMINVGGYKVNPSEVESVIKSINGVKDAIVFGLKNSVLGYIVVANIIKEESVDKKELKFAINTITKEQLQEYKLPRIIKFVDNFKLTRTGKLAKQ